MIYFAIRFLRQVRIRAEEWDAVARALHLKAETRSLPAVKENVSFTTIERKQMSNKTSFKRLALAVVVSLGFGVLSTGPTQAVVNSDTLTLSATTATATIGQASDTASAATVTLSFLATAPVDSMSVTASLVSSPATNTQLPELQLVETTASIVYKAPVGGDTGFMLLASAEAGALSATGAARLNTTALQTNFFGSRVASNDAVFVAAKNRSISAATTVSAKFKVYIPTPAVAGTYVVRLTPAITGNSGSTTIQGTYKDLTITVSAADCVRGCSAPTEEASWSSMYYAATDRGVALDDASNVTLRQGDSVINFTSALTSGTTAQQAANILVYQQNADADIVYTGAIGADQITASNEGGVESMTATISGPGTLGAGADNATSTGRNIIVKAGQHVAVWNDGTSGVATITITGNTTGIVYATKTVNFYGTATTVTVTASTTTVVNSGNLNYRYVSAVAKDANGIVNPVATNTLRLTSSDTLFMNVRMLAPDSSGSTTYSATGAGRPGAYVAYWNLSTATDVTRLSTTKNGEFSFTIGTGGKTPVVGSLTSATATVDSAAAVTVRLSNGIGGATLSFDKTSYRPGEQALLTLTATDSAGSTAATATYSTLLSDVEASGFGTGIPATGSHALVSGVKTFTFTMPNVETTAAIVIKGCLSATTGNTTCTKWTASTTATVADPAVTAANAATTAANAATAAAQAAETAAVAAANAAKTEAAAATAAAKAAQDAAVAAADAATAAATKAGTDAVAAAVAASAAAVAAATKAGADAVAAAEAATDAAAEAIDAANAATDAANLAAEAADAATVAAEEARDAADAATAAVEELATQVATLMSALKAQITTLANVVAKIAKKIKA